MEAAFLTAGWACRRVPGQESVVEADFEAHHARVPLHIQAFDGPGIVSVVARLSFPIAGAALAPAMEALMRMNLQLNIGNFELDPDSGAVCFRVAGVFPAGALDASVLASLVRTAVVETDRATPYLAELNREPGQGVAALLARADLRPGEWVPDGG